MHITADPLGMSMGTVSVGGITKDVCLACVPDVQVGDYVIVHVGFAISVIDEHEAMAVFAFLEQMAALSELDPPPPEAEDDAIR